MVRAFNFMADGFKGNSYATLPEHAKLGVLLHRAIDDFADSAPEAKSMAQPLLPYAGKSYKVALDLLCDFYLHQHWQKFDTRSKNAFIDQCYAEIAAHEEFAKGRIQTLLRPMIAGKWINGYAYPEGIYATARGLNKRFPGMDNLEKGLRYGIEHPEVFEPLFMKLYPALLQNTLDFAKSHTEALSLAHHDLFLYQD